MAKTIVPLKTKDTGWFDVVRYEATKTFAALEWFEQISKRVRISEVLRLGNNAELDRMLPELMTDPLKPSLVGRDFLQEIQKAHGDKAVSPLTFDDVVFLRSVLEEGFASSAEPGEAIEDVLLRHGWLGEAFLHNQEFIRVSLAATNAEILKSVKGWLKDRRKKSANTAVLAWAKRVQADGKAHISKSQSEYSEINQELAAHGVPPDPRADEEMQVHLARHERLLQERVDQIRSLLGGASLAQDPLSSAFAAWNRSCVLAYFDLNVWSKWTGVKLDDNAKVELLYPEDTKDTSALRNAKRAHKLLFEQGNYIVPALLSATLSSNTSESRHGVS